MLRRICGHNVHDAYMMPLSQPTGIPVILLPSCLPDTAMVPRRARARVLAVNPWAEHQLPAAEDAQTFIRHSA
jgi:hypothetical protein